MKLGPGTLAALAGLAVLGVTAPAAGARNSHASTPGRGNTPIAAPVATSCDNPPGAAVFAPFHDRKDYFLAADGGFEGGAAGWTLAGASVADGNEPFDLDGATDSKSLSLPAGSSATSPSICLDSRRPQFRFVARTSGGRHARLKVEVVYLNGNGKPSRAAGTLRASDAWAPTKKLSLAAGRAFARRARTASVELRFTAVGAGDWQIDDVYVASHARR